MTDLEFGSDLHFGLKEEFGRRADWPRGLHVAETLLAAVGLHLGRADALLLLRCTRATETSLRPVDGEVGGHLADLLSTPPVDADTLDLIWPAFVSINAIVGSEHWERFVDAAIAGLSEEDVSLAV